MRPGTCTCGQLREMIKEEERLRAYLFLLPPQGLHQSLVQLVHPASKGPQGPGAVCISPQPWVQTNWKIDTSWRSRQTTRPDAGVHNGLCEEEPRGAKERTRVDAQVGGRGRCRLREWKTRGRSKTVAVAAATPPS